VLQISNQGHAKRWEVLVCCHDGKDDFIFLARRSTTFVKAKIFSQCRNSESETLGFLVILEVQIVLIRKRLGKRLSLKDVG